jgi:hypothetical protein
MTHLTNNVTRQHATTRRRTLVQSLFARVFSLAASAVTIWGIFLPVFQTATFAQETVSGSGWTALTSAGPAVAGFNNVTFVAWKGYYDNAVGYTYLYPGGSVQPQKKVYDFWTTTAPALASTAGTVYVAVRGQSSAPTDYIYYRSLDSSTLEFSKTSDKICAGMLCAQTSAAPALTASGNTLYAAWTTAFNTIEYATYSGGSWTVPATVPTALTYTNPVTMSPTSPALAVYNNALYVAWVAAGSGPLGEVTYSILPLSGGDWSSPVSLPGALTSVAPALQVNVDPKTSPSLILAWTAGSPQIGYTINFLGWNGADADWIPWNPPIPIPPGPLDNYSPALSMTFSGVNTGVCGPETYWFAAAYTLGGQFAAEIMWTPLSSIISPPPPTCKF